MSKSQIKGGAQANRVTMAASSHSKQNFNPPKVQPPQVSPPIIDPPKLDPAIVVPPQVTAPTLKPGHLTPPTVVPPKVEPPTFQSPTTVARPSSAAWAVSIPQNPSPHYSIPFVNQDHGNAAELPPEPQFATIDMPLPTPEIRLPTIQVPEIRLPDLRPPNQRVASEASTPPDKDADNP